jgi:hypothetical protein
MTGLRRTYREGWRQFFAPLLLGGPLVPRGRSRVTRGKEYLWLIVFVGLSLGAGAQGLINQTNLYIPENLSVHIDGDLGNGGFLQNQGTLYLTGNWRNANVYQGLGKVIMEGNGPQTIFNNKNDLHYFTINGSGPIVIEDKLPITGQLDLLSGLVTVGDDDTLLLAPNAAVNGASLQSYVDGAFTVTGPGYKFFPIGKNGLYHPIELLDITGINPITELELLENLPAINVPSAITPYRSVYWNRKTIRGTYIGSPVSIGYQIPDGYTNRHTIEIVQGADLSQEFSPLSGVSVVYGDEFDKVISDDPLTGNFFVIGESIPVGGIPGEFYLSTSLSPRASNPDNHFIKIFGNELAENDFQFLVYNRWGLLVYESHSLQEMISKGWDGRAKNSGDILPSGAYPFMLKAVTKSGELLEKKGVLSILN